MNILEIKQLDFKYNNQLILNKLELAVPMGSIYGYLGKNGSGKTTTIKLLLGLLKAQKNTIYFNGDKEFKNNRLAILKKVGSLIESPCYYGELTGFENLAYLDYIYKCGKKRIDNVLELTDLKEAQHKKVKKYSMGMKQRLGIAIAIFHNPDFLILDEPWNGLDPEGIHDIRKLMFKLRDEGKTILLSSHILSEIEKTCTHIGILSKGNLLYQGDLQTLLSRIEKEIVVKVGYPQNVQRLLIEHSIVSEVLDENALLIKMGFENAYTHLMRVLVANNIEINAIEARESNLESIYLGLTSKLDSL